VDPSPALPGRFQGQEVSTARVAEIVAGPSAEKADSAAALSMRLRFQPATQDLARRATVSPSRTNTNPVVSYVLSILMFWFRKQGQVRPSITKRVMRRGKRNCRRRGVKKTRDLRSWALPGSKLWSCDRKSQHVPPTGGAEGVSEPTASRTASQRPVRETGKAGADAVLSLKGRLPWRWNPDLYSLKQ